MGHGLAQRGLFVRVFHKVDLVYDIHQAARFGHAPEHPVDAQTQFPFLVADLAEKQKIGLPQIGMGALSIPGIETKERRQGETSAPDVFNEDPWFSDNAAAVCALGRNRRPFLETTGFRRSSAR